MDRSLADITAEPVRGGISLADLGANEAARAQSIVGMKFPGLNVDVLSRAPSSTNIEDRRNMDEERYQELWQRAFSPRARQLTPDEREWLVNYAQGRSGNPAMSFRGFPSAANGPAADAGGLIMPAPGK